jgi:hypothetical protein
MFVRCRYTDGGHCYYMHSLQEDRVRP